MDAEQRRRAGADELSLSEVAGLLTMIGERAPRTIAVLTGGEPLLRYDIDEIVVVGVAAGLEVVLGTNGVALTESRIRRFRKLGLAGVGISLDAVNAPAHDRFRGSPGSFARSCRAICRCADNGLHAHVHFTVTRQNQNTLEAAVELARDLGAGIINFFFLVCVGRGCSMLDLTPPQYEQALLRITQLQREQSGIMVQARCAPHFKRVLYEQDPESLYTRATRYDGGGCPAATHYCRVTPAGDVTPCPYIEQPAGNVRDEDFWSIWQGSDLMNTLRRLRIHGAVRRLSRPCPGSDRRSVRGRPKLHVLPAGRRCHSGRQP
jgi:MoaA/NifB/PqqE/SkfB family radical SAM enzyme